MCFYLRVFAYFSLVSAMWHEYPSATSFLTRCSQMLTKLWLASEIGEARGRSSRQPTEKVLFELPRPPTRHAPACNEKENPSAATDRGDVRLRALKAYTRGSHMFRMCRLGSGANTRRFTKTSGCLPTGRAPRERRGGPTRGKHESGSRTSARKREHGHRDVPAEAPGGTGDMGIPSTSPREGSKRGGPPHPEAGPSGAFHGHVRGWTGGRGSSAGAAGVPGGACHRCHVAPRSTRGGPRTVGSESTSPRKDGESTPRHGPLRAAGGAGVSPWRETRRGTRTNGRGEAAAPRAEGVPGGATAAATSPSKHPGGRGHWAKAQRDARKERRLGAGRIQKLEELGISWNVDKRPDQWEARLQEPKEFEEERGHGRVSMA